MKKRNFCVLSKNYKNKTQRVYNQTFVNIKFNLLLNFNSSNQIIKLNI